MKLFKVIILLVIYGIWITILTYVKPEDKNLAKCTNKKFHRGDNPYNLPHFPVPKLDTTLSTYLHAVKPLFTPEAFRKSANIVSKFGEEGGLGQKLQQLLVAKANVSDNWMYDWWTEEIYLANRNPLILYGNPGIFYDKQDFRSEYDWLNYAAKVVFATLTFKEQIDKNELPVDTLVGKYLDMSAFYQIFGTCRIARSPVDYLQFHPDSKHIVVAYQNEFYEVQVYENNSCNTLSEFQILDQLKEILTNKSNVTNRPIGALSSMHRDKLVLAHEHLITYPQNIKSLETITKSLFIVCLDKVVQFNDENYLEVGASQALHGGGSKQNTANRWFEKTIQLIINENGFIGINAEHSPVDGHPFSKLAEQITKYIKSGKFSVPDSEPSKANLLPPHKLNLIVNDNIEADIQQALQDMDEIINDFQLNILYFKDFGKNFIKKQRLSPDSFIQMALQYAFSRLHKEPCSHTEVAQLRAFLYGRTEIIMSCSVESVAFTAAMSNSTISNSEKAEKMKTAIAAHKTSVNMAIAGQGIALHMIGLKLIANENNIPTPSIFLDEVFDKVSNSRMETSQVASSGKHFNSVPAYEDSYCICYNPREDDIFFSISALRLSEKTNCDMLAMHLSASLNHMKDILIENNEN